MVAPNFIHKAQATPSRPPCHLRATRVRLADGLEYTFRALPFNRATVSILEKIESPEVSSAESLLAICDAIERSMSYDQTPAEVAAVFDAGLIPLDLDGPVLKAIMGALFGKAFGGAAEAAGGGAVKET